MGKFDSYKIPLKSLSDGKHSFEYQMDDDYFNKIDSPEIERGDVKVEVTLNKIASTYALQFKLEGLIFISCDRCLDEMEQEISYNGKLYVKFGDDLSQESDEVVIIPEGDGVINLAWYLYEFVVLSIPVKKVHPLGACNKDMALRLEKHIINKIADEDDDESADIGDRDTKREIDPRWDALKDIKDNN